MKKLNDCIVENCIPTPSSCVTWNGGELEFLGICNGASLNTLLWEIVTKLETIAGQDFSKFDISGLLEICKTKAPLEVNLITILQTVRDNQVCLKDYIDRVSDRLSQIQNTDAVNVNLRCYADMDSMGNALSISRENFDQLIINELCGQGKRLNTVEGRLTTLGQEVDKLSTRSSQGEVTLSTCIDTGIKTTSEQIKATAKAICELQTSTGTPTDIAKALAKKDANDNKVFNLLPGWDLSPANWAEEFGNLILKVNNLQARVKYMEENCCAVSCDDVKIGFSAVFNETGDSVILKFTSGAGTKIPNGFTDKGSTGTITDIDGNVETFKLGIKQDLEEEVYITGLNLDGELKINIDAKMTNGAINCDKCLNKVVKPAMRCEFCEVRVQGNPGSSITIVYYDDITITNTQV